MKKQRYNFDDLLTQLRENNIRNLNEVEFGILETLANSLLFEKMKILIQLRFIRFFL